MPASPAIAGQKKGKNPPQINMEKHFPKQALFCTILSPLRGYNNAAPPGLVAGWVSGCIILWFLRGGGFAVGGRGNADFTERGDAYLVAVAAGIAFAVSFFTLFSYLYQVKVTILLTLKDVKQ